MKRGINQVQGDKATPIKTIAQKREEAEKRQVARDKRGDTGQIKMLDKLFGKGKGAERERKRITQRFRKAKK